MDVTFTGPNNSDNPAQSFRLFIEETQPKPEDLKTAGEWLVEKRRKDTLAGVGVDGGIFAPYSPRYVSRKGSAGVNLYSANRRTGGHMLDALTYRVSDSGSSAELDVGVFGNSDLAMRAEVMNEGATVRTRLGTGLEGFKTHPGRKRTPGKSVSKIPARNWLGATDSDLLTMQTLIADSVAQRLAKGGN